MRSIRVSEDIVPIGEFKGQAAHWLRRVSETGQPVVITQNGKPAGVLLSPRGIRPPAGAAAIPRIDRERRRRCRRRPADGHTGVEAAAGARTPVARRRVRVLWTEQAFARLAEIETYIAADDPAVARRFVARLIERASRLAKAPHMGRWVPELPESKLRELIEGNYRIVYRVRGKTVQVLTVFEGSSPVPGA